MAGSELPPMEPLAPVVDELRTIAQAELPSPRACKVQLWDDGDYDIRVYHKRGPDTVERIVYETATGEVLWQRRKGKRYRSEPAPDGDGTVMVPEFEAAEDRHITTIEPPIEV